MSDGVTLKRIIDLDTQSSIGDGVYTIVDSEADKAKKFNLGGALSNLKGELNKIENLQGSRVAYHPTFQQGSITPSTGVIYPDNTAACHCDLIPMKSGDSIVYKRYTNKINSTSYLVVYDSNRSRVSSANFSSDGNATTYNFTTDGYFAVSCALNTTVSATMAEAIESADNSYTASLYEENTLISTIHELDERLDDVEEEMTSIASLIEFSEIVIEENGLRKTKTDMLTGKYYSLSEGVVTLSDNAASVYANLIDVSAFIGKPVIIWLNKVKSGSTRSFGLCDASGNVGNYITETSLKKMADGSRRAILIVDKQYLFISCSDTPTEIIVEIPAEYLFAERESVDFRFNTKKYYHMSFDDVILCLQDITTNASTYESIFENNFFGWCKEMHTKYGTTFSMYVFYADDASNPTWTLEDCTSAFADEFTENASWLKFGYHAYAQGSTATSREASAATDYSNAITQIVRITGSVNCVDRAPRLQSYTGTLTALTAMRDCDLGCVGFLASADYSASEPRDSYYFTQAQNDYIGKHIYMFDAENHLHFVKTSLVWGASNVGVAAENSIQYYNANKYVEIFTHENQLTSGTKTSMETKFAALSYSHIPYYLMDLVLTS